MAKSRGAKGPLNVAGTKQSVPENARGSIISGMTKRLAVADGSYNITESGDVPGEVWNPLRAKRSK